MLTAADSLPLTSGAGHHFVVVASRYNARYVDGMLEACLATFRAAGSSEPEVVYVPGAWEIPVAAVTIARRPARTPSALICLGVILQGQTSHAQHIGDCVSDGLMQISIEFGVPVIHEVLTISSEAQAEERCLNPRTNKGAEAARTALHMADLLGKLR